MYFVGRQQQGPYTAQDHLVDPILARILWLEGCQWCNRHTKKRYIYLHGCADLDSLGKSAQSHGCIRLSPRDATQVARWYLCSPRTLLVYSKDTNHPLPWQSMIQRILPCRL